MTEMLQRATEIVASAIDAADTESDVPTTEGEGSPDPADRGSAPDPEEVGRGTEEGSAVADDSGDADTDDEPVAEDGIDSLSGTEADDDVEEFELPDGRKVTADEIIKQFTKPSDSREVPSVDDIVAKVVEQLRGGGRQSDERVEAGPDVLDNPNGWLANRWDEYARAGYDMSNRDAMVQQCKSDLIAEQNFALHSRMKAKDIEAESRQKDEARKALISSLTSAEAAPNLQSETGKRILGMALAQAQLDNVSDEDLPKVIKSANDLVASFITETYTKPKQAKLRRLKASRIPAGGTPRATTPKKESHRYEGVEGMMRALRTSMAPQE